MSQPETTMRDQSAERPKTRWHSLKTWPEPFDAVFRGQKKFEVRRNDRGFVSGDGLHLLEWNPETGCYTGRECYRMIKYILDGGQFGIEPGFVAMSIS